MALLENGERAAIADMMMSAVEGDGDLELQSGTLTSKWINFGSMLRRVLSEGHSRHLGEESTQILTRYDKADGVDAKNEVVEEVRAFARRAGEPFDELPNFPEGGSWGRKMSIALRHPLSVESGEASKVLKIGSKTPYWRARNVSGAFDPAIMEVPLMPGSLAHSALIAEQAMMKYRWGSTHTKFPGMPGVIDMWREMKSFHVVPPAKMDLHNIEISLGVDGSVSVSMPRFDERAAVLKSVNWASSSSILNDRFEFDEASARSISDHILLRIGSLMAETLGTDFQFADRANAALEGSARFKSDDKPRSEQLLDIKFTGPYTVVPDEAGRKRRRQPIAGRH